jgi:intergrase/recombinase
MNRTSKVTKIEKKYKDKKTGEFKSMTIEYSKVADRVKEFRQDCPFGETTTDIKINGEYIFASAVATKDRSNPQSATASGHAIAKLTGNEKEFEKLETLAVGRALAFLGYGASGEIASSEEMEEFMEYQKTKKEEEIETLIEQVNSIKTIEELRLFYSEHKGFGAELDLAITNKSKELKNANS